MVENKITEFEITYITKEYLMRNGWIIIAYNPPGSQGTFTIPDPIKDPNYKGQTGSMSPDIVAYDKKKNLFLIVEAKPTYNKNDVIKMIKMFKTPNRIKVFYEIVKGYAIANNLNVIINNETKIIFAKSHSGEANLTSGLNINTILINKTTNLDPHNFSIKENIYSQYEIKAYFSNTST